MWFVGEPGGGLSSASVADGVIYPTSLVGNERMLYRYEDKKGTVGLVRATPKSFEVTSSFEVSQGSGSYRSQSVISTGRLYISHGKRPMTYDIRGVEED